MKTEAPVPPAADGKKLWVRMSMLEDARMEPVRQAFSRFPGKDRAILYLVSARQKVTWQRGIDALRVQQELLPLLGEANLVIKE